VNASLITGLYEPAGIAVSGPDLFVTQYYGVVGEYTTSGVTVNSSLIVASDGTQGIAVIPQTVPEPSSWTLFLGGWGLLAFWRMRRIVS